MPTLSGCTASVTDEAKPSSQASEPLVSEMSCNSVDHVSWDDSQPVNPLLSGSPPSEAMIKERSYYIKMAGREVFKVAVQTLARIVDETLEKNGLEAKDIDWLVPHQANIRIIEATARKLGMPMERVIVTVQDHGNTSAASVPMALDVAVRDGRIKRGDTLLLEAFGGGFTWGSALVRY